MHFFQTTRAQGGLGERKQGSRQEAQDCEPTIKGTMCTLDHQDTHMILLHETPDVCATEQRNRSLQKRRSSGQEDQKEQI